MVLKFGAKLLIKISTRPSISKDLSLRRMKNKNWRILSLWLSSTKEVNYCRIEDKPNQIIYSNRRNHFSVSSIASQQLPNQKNVTIELCQLFRVLIWTMYTKDLTILWWFFLSKIKRLASRSIHFWFTTSKLWH